MGDRSGRVQSLPLRKFGGDSDYATDDGGRRCSDDNTLTETDEDDEHTMTSDI